MDRQSCTFICIFGISDKSNNLSALIDDRFDHFLSSTICPLCLSISGEEFVCAGMKTFYAHGAAVLLRSIHQALFNYISIAFLFSILVFLFFTIITAQTIHNQYLFLSYF